MRDMFFRNMFVSLLLWGIIFLSSILLTELSVRFFAQYLPISVQIYVQPELKRSLPDMMKNLIAFNPWGKGRQSNDDVGWTFSQGLLREGVNEDGEQFSRRASSEGFFTPDEPDRKTSQLVVLGDSFVSTFYVKNPIPWVVRKHLKIPVYNLAVGGWGPESYREAFGKYACDRKLAGPVLVFSFLNDISDVANWNLWKKYNESNGSVTFLEWIWKKNPKGAKVNNDEGWFDQHSLLWNWIKYTYYYGIEPIFDSARNNSEKSVIDIKTKHRISEAAFTAKDGSSYLLNFNTGYLFANADPEFFMPAGGYGKYMSEYFDSLRRLRKQIIICGGDMLLIWIPAKERVYYPLLSIKEYKKFVKNNTGLIDGYEAALSQFVTEEKINFLDLTPKLIELARQGEQLYFRNDGHLNNRGNQAVGLMVSDFVKPYMRLH